MLKVELKNRLNGKLEKLDSIMFPCAKTMKSLTKIIVNSKTLRKLLRTEVEGIRPI